MTGQDVLSSGDSPRPPRVFLSYCQEVADAEHGQRVLDLANCLRSHGVDARLDLYEASPAEGWPLWRRRQIESADFVIVVCTATYRRRFDGNEQPGTGNEVRWEGSILRQILFDDATFGARVIPVLFDGTHPDQIPIEIAGQTRHQLPRDFDDLYRYVTGQIAVETPPLGELRWRLSNLGPRPPIFIGRELELASIAGPLPSPTSAASIHALVGLGGVGKSRLALEYAHRSEGDHDIRWWVRASNLQQDLADLGRALGILSTPNVIDRSVEETLAWLRIHRRWLLVVDNADGPEAIREYLPTSGAGRILITSRAQAWRGTAIPIEIKTLPREAAVELLLTRSGCPDDGQAAALAEALGDLPLALVQAAAYIEQAGCTYAEYLQLLNQEGLELLRQRLGDPGDYYRGTVATTWKLNSEAIRKERASAGLLLDFLAFLDPDGVPLALLREHPKELPLELARLVGSQVELDVATALLRRYSLVERSGGSLRVHRLVQVVTRDALAAELRGTIALATVRWVVAAFDYVPGGGNLGSVPAGIVEQILAVSSLRECTDIGGGLLVPPLCNLCDCLRNLGNTRAAQQASVRAIELAEVRMRAAPEDPSARHLLGGALRSRAFAEEVLGNWALVRQLRQQAVEIYEALERSGPLDAHTRRGYAVVLRDLADSIDENDPRAALRHLVRSQAITEELLKSEPGSTQLSLDLVITLGLRSHIESSRDKRPTARVLLERSLAILESMVAADPENFVVQRFIAMDLRALSAFEPPPRAKSLFDRAFKIEERLAANNPRNALVIMWYAWSHLLQC